MLSSCASATLRLACNCVLSPVFCLEQNHVPIRTQSAHTGNMQMCASADITAHTTIAHRHLLQLQGTVDSIQLGETCMAYRLEALAQLAKNVYWIFAQRRCISGYHCLWVAPRRSSTWRASSRNRLQAICRRPSKAWFCIQKPSSTSFFTCSFLAKGQKGFFSVFSA